MQGATSCPCRPLPRIKKHAGEGFAVQNRALVDHFEHLGELDQAEFDPFVLLRVGVARQQALGHENLHGFAQEAGAGVVLGQQLPLLCPVAGFLGQFALGAGQGVFAGLQLAGRQLP